MTIFDSQIDVGEENARLKFDPMIFEENYLPEAARICCTFLLHLFINLALCLQSQISQSEPPLRNQSFPYDFPLSICLLSALCLQGQISQSEPPLRNQSFPYYFDYQFAYFQPCVSKARFLNLYTIEYIISNI